MDKAINAVIEQFMPFRQSTDEAGASAGVAGELAVGLGATIDVIDDPLLDERPIVHHFSARRRVLTFWKNWLAKVSPVDHNSAFPRDDADGWLFYLQCTIFRKPQCTIFRKPESSICTPRHV